MSCRLDYESLKTWTWEAESVAGLYRGRREVMRHSLNGFTAGSREVLRWIDGQIAQFERRINSVIWC